jgi:hypothetical protein
MRSVRWHVVLAAILAVALLVGSVLFLPPAFRVIREETQVSYAEEGRYPRPGLSDSWAGVFRASSGGAVGATWSHVYLLSSSDSLPGKSDRLLWSAKRVDVQKLEWRTRDSLDVYVVNDRGLRLYRNTITEQSRNGIKVRTIEVAEEQQRWRR